MTGTLLPGRARDVVVSSGARIRVHEAGRGEPVLLLHGWPQTSAAWHRVVPALADAHRVVLADLPGYGDSVLPAGAPAGASGKRAMAADLVEVMTRLGHDRFAVAGHDRGARCAYRMALDHPDRVRALAVLDVLPTADVLAGVDARFARSAWHWFVLSQPSDVAERLLAADPEAVLARGLADVCDPRAIAEYRAAWERPNVQHGMCQDYRAGFDVDGPDDEADRGRRTVGCPALALWGGHGPLGHLDDVLSTWRVWAPRVTGRALAAGHHLPEEAPDEVCTELLALLAGAPSPAP